MKQNILIALGVIILVTLWVQYLFPNFNETDRYEVISNSNMLTILVDKKTGLTWRNSICDEKSNVPGCWAKMYPLNQETFNMPAGDAVISSKILPKYIKKLEKQKAEQAKAQQRANQPIPSANDGKTIKIK